MNPVFLENLARIKKAAAITNRDAFALDAGYAEAIIRACDEVIKGRFREEFIVDAIQGGAGTVSYTHLAHWQQAAQLRSC